MLRKQRKKIFALYYLEFGCKITWEFHHSASFIGQDCSCLLMKAMQKEPNITSSGPKHLAPSFSMHCKKSCFALLWQKKVTSWRELSGFPRMHRVESSKKVQGPRTGAIKKPHWVKAFVVKPNNLSLIPRMYSAKGNNWLSPVALWAPLACCSACIPTHVNSKKV